MFKRHKCVRHEISRRFTPPNRGGLVELKGSDDKTLEHILYGFTTIELGSCHGDAKFIHVKGDQR